MKKILVVLLALTFLVSLSGCSKRRPEDLYGIYGVSQMFYKNVENEYTNYGDKFDYIVLVVNNNNTLDIYYRLTDKEEQKISTNYEMTIDEESDEITAIVLNKFIRAGIDSEGITYVYEMPTDSSETSTHSISFNKSGNLVDKTIRLKDLFDWSKTTKYKALFKKFSSKINTKYLEKAKQSQIKEKENRVVNTNNDTQERE